MQRKKRIYPTVTVKCPKCGFTYTTEKKYANSFKCFSCWVVCKPVSITNVALLSGSRRAGKRR